jgi:hypothetical protein
MKRIMIVKKITAPSGLDFCPTNRYVLEFESERSCDNKNQIIYNVVAEKIKHDIRENLTLEQLMNLYE